MVVGQKLMLYFHEEINLALVMTDAVENGQQLRKLR